MKRILFRTLLGGAFALASVFTVSAQVDRSKAPVAGPTPKLTVPAAQTFTLNNGLKVHLISKHDVPLVALQLVVKAGSADESAAQLGLSRLTALVMRNGGAGSRDGLAFDEEVNFLGIALSASSGLENSYINLFAPVSKLKQGLDLTADLVARPRFDPAELERRRKLTITQLISTYDQPGAIAAQAAGKYLAGDAHPFGRTSVGTEATVKALTIDDLKAFHAKYFVPANAYLIVAGDLTVDQAKAALEASLGQWTGGAAPVRPPVAAIKQVKGRKIILIDKPGAVQSEIRVMRGGVVRNTPDYYAITVMNTILGGSFTSRLNANLREKNGYTYGARSGFNMQQTFGTFQAAAAVQTDKTAPAVQEFLNELKGIRTITAEDASKARNYVALGYPSSFASVQSLVGELNERVQFNLPENYFNTYVINVLGVTHQQAAAVAAKYVDPSNVLIIIVGDKEKVLPELQKMKLGPVELHTITDVLGPMPAAQ